MNKHLFAIFLLVVSSGLCASEKNCWYDFPGGTGHFGPLSPQKNVPYLLSASYVDESCWSSVPSQSSSKSSTPEVARKDLAKKPEMAEVTAQMAALALQNAACKESAQQ